MPKLNSKHAKTLEAIFVEPTKATIPFSDIEALFVALGGSVIEGAGSRVMLRLSNGQGRRHHRPHPGKEAKRYQVDDIREFLREQGITP